MLGRNPAADRRRDEPQRKPAAAVGLGFGTALCVHGAALIGHQEDTPTVGRRGEHVVIVVIVPSCRFAVDAPHLGNFLLGEGPDAVDIRTA